jgi:hypothetical protein
MDGHVWRVPTLVGIMACGALVLFAGAVVASNVTRRGASKVTRLAIAVVLALLAVVTGMAIRTAAWRFSRALDLDVAHVDPGPLGYLAPVMFATFAWMVGKRLLHHSWASRSALLYYVWLVAFTAVNTVNRCSPGWCTTVGFPFAWQSWSDAIFVPEHENVRAFLDAMGVVLNLATFVAVAAVITRNVRVSRGQNGGPQEPSP